MAKKKSLSKAELKLISDLLESAAIILQDDTNCDYIVQATDENKEIIIDMIENNKDPFCIYNIDDIRDEKDEIVIEDYRLMKHFAKRCRELL